MDRKLASKNIRLALVITTLGFVMFGLTFVATFGLTFAAWEHHIGTYRHRCFQAAMRGSRCKSAP